MQGPDCSRLELPPEDRLQVNASKTTARETDEPLTPSARDIDAARFIGATIHLFDVEVLVIQVAPRVLGDRGEAPAVVAAFQARFRRTIVLVAQDCRGVPTYFGPSPIAAVLAMIPFDAFTWRRYRYRRPPPQMLPIPIDPLPSYTSDAEWSDDEAPNEANAEPDATFPGRNREQVRGRNREQLPSQPPPRTVDAASHHRESVGRRTRTLDGGPGAHESPHRTVDGRVVAAPESPRRTLDGHELAPRTIDPRAWAAGAESLRRTLDGTTNPGTYEAPRRTLDAQVLAPAPREVPESLTRRRWWTIDGNAAPSTRESLGGRTHDADPHDGERILDDDRTVPRPRLDASVRR